MPKIDVVVVQLLSLDHEVIVLNLKLLMVGFKAFLFFSDCLKNVINFRMMRIFEVNFSVSPTSKVLHFRPQFQAF